MAELVVVGFHNPTDADRVLTELTRLQKEYLIELEDAVVAIRSQDGTVRIKQSVNLVSLGATTGGLRGALWGSLIGLLFLNPLAGFAIGGAVGVGSGALSGSMIDYGINDGFIRSIGETLKPETSALFLLIRKSQPEKVLAELAGFKGHVIRSSLSPEQEAKLQAALTRAHSPSPSEGVEAVGTMAAQPT
ncbi:DUF1269 domain-containing protein [Microvirga lotononidis]|uniref:Putative membrane protein n=1 Tax=Microvirga lotononidis TaxID=864069 RepID=I4YN69_9HYPH|nr:DUF1269 domain-containing protein [Microvirga lotononidis]EIM25411.1 putative membrane protein [Microvirga lotononidis]WQO27296.1 DUF1269 domain-containing protein [Microvirga lotononidis]